VRRDVIRGYFTTDDALTDYGVVLQPVDCPTFGRDGAPTDLTIDQLATARARRERRA